MNWRYATKKFDPNRKISADDLETLKEAIRLSASSYGLQLYKVLVIEDAELKSKLRPATWNQGQVEEASHVFVFCNYTEVNPEHVNGYLQLKADTQGLDVNNLKGYSDFILGKMEALTPEAIKNWTARQTYLALGNLLNICAELRIDSCPMEGFDAAQYDEILGLKAKGLTTAVVATVGYRSEEDAAQHGKKVRKPAEQLFETI